MGITELVPGVSSGTLAMIIGIYDQLILSINDLFSKKWKKALPFLIPLGIGMVFGLLSFVRIINYLLENHFEPTRFFFLGLIVGVLPLLFKQADMKNKFTKKHYVTLVISIFIVAMLDFFPTPEGEPIISLTLINGIGLFVSGWIASMAMLLPGISGSLLLLILGVYETATNALATFNIPIILVIGSGVMLGFLISSKIIKGLLKNYYSITYAALIGLVIGSTVIIYPGISSTVLILPCIVTFILGALTAIFFSTRS